MPRAAAARRLPATGHPAATGGSLILFPGMTVGLFGGSFNPPHAGHAHVARTAVARLGLDRVLWLVSPQNPLKPADETAAYAGRLARVRKIARGPAMQVSDIERRLGTPYTIDTVRWLKARYPGVRFVWIMGADSLAGFHRWRGWTDLVREVPIAVVSRPGSALRSRASPMARRFAAFRHPASLAPRLAGMKPPAWLYLTAPFHFVSSTALRREARRAIAA